MRPDVLNPLFASAATLPRIGPRTARALAKLVGSGPADGDARVVDLLWHWPTRLIDRRSRPTVAAAQEGALATIEVTVGRHEPSGVSRRPYKVRVHDDTGDLSLVFFHAKPGYLAKLLPVGEARFVSGRVETFAGERQIVHPDYVVTPRDFAAMPAVEPVYPLTAGVSNRVLVTGVAAALEGLPALPEWQDAPLLERHGWVSFPEALKAVHGPKGEADLDPLAPARTRLAFDELLANQLALAVLRRHRRRLAGRAIRAEGRLAAKAREALPFKLTAAQEAAIGEIVADMAREEQMVRLLQGDVGSGKTLVAALAMLTVAEAGAQSALMAPTELLARQHHDVLSPLFEAAGARAAVLTGREQGAARRETLASLREGSISALIGTHALFQEEVEFADLALAVIDEQHRFGVHQRLALQAKSKRGASDLLVMTATPIPRTLVLTHYGNMEVTRIDERPPGRARIETRVLAAERVDEVVGRLEAAVARGARAYWICPQIDENGEEQAAAAIARHQSLGKRLGRLVALAHGRMAAAERDAAMAAFRDGEAPVLVATTVVEVGVDVPEATIMVVEQAERFGLTQLHQLRGRVGRGRRDSACLLLYSTPLGDIAARRLEIMRTTDDGFRIAEEDLALRGGGEVLGTRQSGMPGFRIADPVAHAPMIEAARDQAGLILERAPTFTGPTGEAARLLLYLFERDEAIRLTGSG